MDYKNMKIEDIIEWCKANNQVAWLKEIASKKVEYKVYPKVKKVDASGKKYYETDKTAEPKIELRSISFIQIKLAFVDKFMPEIKPAKKEKKVSMFDLIDAL